MKRLLPLLLLFLSLFLLTAWTLEDCVEVNFDHPDCDRYVTTTTFTDQITTTTIGETTTTEVPPSTTSSTVQPGSTTSTSGAENSTTTSTPSEQPTTTVTSDTPTTTIQQCPAGTIHQPPMCVPTAVPFFDTTTPDTTAVISPPEELPFTGAADLGLLALAGVSLLFLGFTALKYGRRPG